MNDARATLPADSAITRWLDGASAPVRAGVYLRRAPAGPFTCWDGEHWRADAATPAAAAREDRASQFLRSPWRGLIAPSDAPCATCRGHTVLDHGIDAETGADLIEECPDC